MTDAPCLSSTPRSGVIAPNESATHGTGRDAGTDDCTWRNPNGNNVCIACDLAARRWRIADYERVSPEARCGRSADSYVLSLALYSTHLAGCILIHSDASVIIVARIVHRSCATKHERYYAHADA